MIYFCLYVIALYSASPEANKAVYLLFKSCGNNTVIEPRALVTVEFF